MIAYHVDRNNALKSNQTIELSKIVLENNSDSLVMMELFSKEGISNHGFHYLTDPPAPLLPGDRISYHIMEYELELVRRSFFPHLPSRFQSFFALESLDNIDLWDGILNVPDISVWKIQYDDSQCARLDSNLLIPTLKEPSPDNKCSLFFSPNDAFFTQYKYWSGKASLNPRFELLIKPPVKILERVHIDR